ncbi:DUF5721 family protein [Kineothrix sp. MB12-C1]|uniref:DUF5721 family protein n=1 Tax=Kineothrix sp. MB12-C1 TaxID=3070215 RepID=UPI0027D2BF9A|nr:DUF5721 family protein [Kineothrix sp. MB12-C1]WMC91993.1 DUF5721 family protein [Kineothrix sp. MB12-C1]
MKAYQINDLKNFMNKLLLSESFDFFLLEEGTIVTYNTFHIDGHIRKDFYTKEEQEDSSLCPYDFSLWKDMRPLCFQLIKGKRTPISFKFVLLLLPGHRNKILSTGGYEEQAHQVKSFLLTVKYDGTAATIITGTSTNTFLMDKTPEHLWDQAFQKFMDKQQIIWEEL